MSNDADTDVGKVAGDVRGQEFRGGEAEEKLADIFDRRPPNTRSGNEWVRIKAAAETRRRQ